MSHPGAIPAPAPLGPVDGVPNEPPATEDPNTPRRPSPLGASTDPAAGPVPLKVPPLGSSPNPTAAPPGPGQPGAPTPATPAPGSTTPAPATADPTAPGGDKHNHRHHDHNGGDNDTDADTPPPAGPPPDGTSALNGLANMVPQIASPLMGAATGIPAAALQGAGSLIPSLAAAVLPQLQALASQLGTGASPDSAASRIGTGGADSLAGPMGALAGQGPAADRARDQSQALQRRVSALHDVEHQLSDVLGLSSARNESDRAKIQGVIDDVESALISASVQGDTPEAQAAVLTAMRKGLDEAGGVVTAAARAKLTDAQFVKNLIHSFLSTAGGPDSLQAAAAATGTGAAAARFAHDALGTPYVWGGGGPLGPTKGGFDCSGLTQWAVARATGGRVILPRTTYDQIHTGSQVPLNALAPGDLVFSNFSSPGVPEHVAIYVGNGQIIEAPTPGVPVRISHVPSGAQARRVI